MSDETRTDRILHDTFWTTMQKAVRDAEDAIREARPLITKLRDLSDENSGERYMASSWLADHGE